MELLDTYTYEDPHDVFERPPYCVKFCSDVLGLNLLDFFLFLMIEFLDISNFAIFPLKVKAETN